MILALDHVQLAMPTGAEDEVRAFYKNILGFQEIPKPKALQSRGGCWFSSHGVSLHLGVEADFKPAHKAHPAFLVHDLRALAERLSAHHYPVKKDDAIEGVERFFSQDCLGNRLEFIQQ